MVYIIINNIHYTHHSYILVNTEYPSIGTWFI